MLEKNPFLTRIEIENLLKDNSDKIGNLSYIDNRNDYYGYGKVNLSKIIKNTPLIENNLEFYYFNNDNIIDIIDIMQVASKWNSKYGESIYDFNFDFNDDGTIDIQDIMVIAKNWSTNFN